MTTNVAGQACSFTVISPVLTGHDEPLRTHLRTLELGHGSPVAALGTVHFARWVVFACPEHPSARDSPDPRQRYLLFDCCFDGSLNVFLETMRSRMQGEVDAIWRHCVGYPGSSDGRAFAEYLLRHQVDASVFLAAYPDATVQEVHASLELRSRVIEFAVTTQDLDAPALLAAFHRSFAGARFPGVDVEVRA